MVGCMGKVGRFDERAVEEGRRDDGGMGGSMVEG